MPNMSYCRFRNTLTDLQECEEALNNGDEIDDDEEQRARTWLIKLCHRIAEDWPLEDL